jgi:hypothetical protein
MLKLTSYASYVSKMGPKWPFFAFSCAASTSETRNDPLAFYTQLLM